VISLAANLTKVFPKKNRNNTLRVGFEESSLLSGFLHAAYPSAKLYRFIKADLEWTQQLKVRKTAFVWRVFAGAGYGLPFKPKDGKVDSNNYYMPFFRQYYAGGPNSMRAWLVRKLGPGSAIKSYATNIAPDRFGDMRLECNLEYRYYLFKLMGFEFEGAVFADMGNVWFIRPNNDFPDGEFNAARFWKDVGIGTGTGLRADLSFIKIRLDYAYKAKNPSPDEAEAFSQNKWFYDWKLFSGQLQIAINYAF